MVGDSLIGQIGYMGLPRKRVRYDAINLDSIINSGGGTTEIKLHRNDVLLGLQANIVLGSLSGGTSPAWTVSASNPVITQFALNVSGNNLFSVSTLLQYEKMKLLKGIPGNGQNLLIDVADMNLTDWHYMEMTGLPTFNYSDVSLKIQLPALSSLTSGSPTASSGTTLYLTELVVPREQALAFIPKFIKVGTVQVNFNAINTGTGELTLPDFVQLGYAYKDMLLFTSSSNNFISGSDNIVNYFKVKVNNSIDIIDDFWQILKFDVANLFRVIPDAGFNYITFMQSGNLNNLLKLYGTGITSANFLYVSNSAGYISYLAKVYYPM
jgi:hypothetical protein